MTKVAIQGNAGCFHEIAARRFYGPRSVDTVYCDTFEDVFSAMQANPDECLGMIAIENTAKMEAALLGSTNSISSMLCSAFPRITGIL